MQELGQHLLLVAFFVTLSTALTAVAGALTRNLSLMKGARYGVYASTALYVAMAIVLTHGFLSHDFSNKYIATYSDRSMPVIYLLAAFWGGEKGALLFWTTSLTIFSAIAVRSTRDRDPVYVAWAIAVLMGAVFFFDILMVFESNPFETYLTSGGPRDGKGLNPLLQNPTMAFHPPSLLTGYITFTIPFAFAMAALISGRLGEQWITDTRRWTLVSWGFLSVGLILGCLWAYEELGWGFWWMWDPVENAGFIPWCTATAFLHSVMIQERRGMLKRWNMVLVCLTFFLTIFGTFLTRSQLIDSIHAFADSTLAEYFLYYLALLFVVSAVLISWRWRALRSEASVESFWSRESFFILNNVMLVFVAAIVLYGTVYPKMSEAEGFQAFQNGLADLWNGSVGGFLGPMETLNQGVTLGEDWFNQVLPPFGLALLLLMGMGPLISWRRATVRNFRRNFQRPLIGSSLLMAVVTGWTIWARVGALQEEHGLTFGAAYAEWTASLDVAHYYAFLVYFLGSFVAWTVGREFHRGAQIRKRRGGDSYVVSMIGLVFKNPRRYGGYIVHIGVIFMFLAFTGKVFKIQLPERLMGLGDQISVSDYRVTYSGAEQRWDGAGGYALTRAIMTVLRDDETVHPDHLEEVVQWLTSEAVGAFHVETTLGSPAVTVHFQDQSQRGRLTHQAYLAHTFRPQFDLILESPERSRLTYRVHDQGLMKVMPRAAMERLRAARDALDEGEGGERRVRLTPGSPELVIEFGSPEGMKAFLASVSAAEAPPWLLLCQDDLERGALEIIHAGTGLHMTPEVRFFAKHDTPTTETAISSTLVEDFYLAIRPAMGGGGGVNLLTVVFPLVSLLWAGAIILVLGCLLCMSPRWFGQVVMSLTRGGRAATLTGLWALLAVGAMGATSPVWAAPLPEPRGLAPPAGDPTEDVLSRLTCGCPERVAGDGRRTLADVGCDCPSARVEREVVAELMAAQGLDAQASGRARLKVLYALVAVRGDWDARLRYDTRVYHRLLETTKTTCAGERGLVLAQSQLSCSVRRAWLPRFRVMLAAGMPTDSIFRLYVDECNATMAPSVPWSYEDLMANPGQELSWIVPSAALMVALMCFAVVMVRKSRRPLTATSEASREAQGRDGGGLTPAQRLMLEDELDGFDV